MDTLLQIQTELKAPKNNRNTFGNYNYRSAEDILEAVKPLLKKYDAQLVLSDEIIEVGGRIYVKATAVFTEPEGKDKRERITVTAYAREAEAKKGMDESQITGTASSYARKYALNGLFLIDDTKDADTDEHIKQATKWDSLDERDAAIAELKKVLAAAGKTEAALLKHLELKDIRHITKDQCTEWTNTLKEVAGRKQEEHK